MTRARILNSLWRHDGCLRRFSIVRDKRDKQNSIVQLIRQFFQYSSLDHHPLHSHAINLTPIKWTRDIDKSFRHWWRDWFMKLKLITLSKDTKVNILNLNFLTPEQNSGDNVVSPCTKNSEEYGKSVYVCMRVCWNEAKLVLINKSTQMLHAKNTAKPTSRC